MVSLPELKVTVYSDYICPFCYVGHHRLQRLRDNYNLKINWCFLEIHPETSAQGEPIDSLEYPSEQWQLMLENLERVSNAYYRQPSSDAQIELELAAQALQGADSSNEKIEELQVQVRLLVANLAPPRA